MVVCTASSPSPEGKGEHSPLKRKRSVSLERPSHLPDTLLLLALPALLVLPPTHPHHLPSLRLSFLAVRRCLQLRDRLTPVVECRAWFAFVELSMKIIEAGLNGDGHGGVHWASGLEKETSVAIGKGLVLSQSHPGLRSYTHHLKLFHARLAHLQRSHRFARSLLKRHIVSLSTTDPPAYHYVTHLTCITHALDTSPIDLRAALHSLSAIEALASAWGHTDMHYLGQVIKLRTLVSAMDWVEAFPLLATLESAFHLFAAEDKKEQKPPFQSESAHTCFELHVLALGILAHVQAGCNKDTGVRIARFHAALDSGSLEREEIRDGFVEIPLGTSPPLRVLTTHPRVLFHLAFLVSTVALRDVGGRRPKPKVFATEGLAVCERERPKDTEKGVGRYPRWAGLRERQVVEERLGKIEADLLSEMIAVCIQRSEFEEAEEHLARLIMHTRTHALWDVYSARITLQHAQLAHARCNHSRALQCYRAAAHLAAKDEASCDVDSRLTGGIVVARFVRVAAQAGEVGLRLGIARREMGPGEELDDRFRKWSMEVAKECRAIGGMLDAVGHVLEACLADEIVVAKSHLKTSLRLTTDALDNHLRTLVLSFTSSHYLHTSVEYAEVMLTTARQLAAGLGAPATKKEPKSAAGPRKVGNAPLGLWIGQRLLELYLRTGQDSQGREQEAINRKLEGALKSNMARRDLDVDGDVVMT